MQWHLDDSVSDAERQRNDVIHSWQGNRNPFIDRPEFANQIWATQCPAISPTINDGSPTPTAVDLDELRERIDAIEAEIRALRTLVDRLDPSE